MRGEIAIEARVPIGAREEGIRWKCRRMEVGLCLVLARRWACLWR